MSSGAFVRSFYELDNGDVARCRVQPETIAGFNSPPAGPATVPGSARMNGSRRKAGINARSVSLAWTAAPPAGYKPDAVVRVPILDPDVYNGLDLGDTVTYLGANAEVIGKTGEKIA
jgi:hypothetical protein